MMVANLRSGNPNQILKIGGLAQLVERLLCKQEVSGSTPLSSTRTECLVHGIMNRSILKGCPVYYSIIGY